MAAPPEVLERCELYVSLPAETRTLYNDLWIQLGIGGEESRGLLEIIRSWFSGE
jgi:hypothetical protein